MLIILIFVQKIISFLLYDSMFQCDETNKLVPTPSRKKDVNGELLCSIVKIKDRLL